MARRHTHHLAPRGRGGLRRLTWGLLGGLAALALGAGPAPAADFATVAAQVTADRAVAERELAQTRETLAQERQALAARLAELARRNAALTAQLSQDQAALGELSRRRAAAAERLAQEQGSFKELSGLVRAAARELLGLARRSAVTAQAPGRLARLRALLAPGNFAGLEEVRELAGLYLQEIRLSGQVARWSAPLVDQEGREITGQVLRVGGLNSFYQTPDQEGYLEPSPDTGRLLALAGDMPRAAARDLAAYLAGTGQALYLDLTGGAALQQMAHQETWQERLAAGGPLVWPILGVGLVALLLLGERLVFLGRVRANTDRVMGRVAALVVAGDLAGAGREADRLAGRPTGRVLARGLALMGQSREVIETALSEAVLRELPRLERFLTALKVLAGVAPLLGLLGTVTGMINTFQVITLYGSGDPRLLAGGISEALVTTQLGLGVAIPILLAASLLGRRAQNLTSDLEEKALGLAAALIQARENGGPR
ncbi:MAG: MotA/TolQ/ExbB proton channel family protein [Deltaproteobacteria bacterium]|nr:MotA/TolQ/ExbB proton channel family protein [Deltaproteobacteria bacterium]